MAENSSISEIDLTNMQSVQSEVDENGFPIVTNFALVNPHLSATSTVIATAAATMDVVKELQ